MGGKKQHQGSCHCGKVRFEVASGLDNIIACNCSICAKQGLWLTFVPAGDFTLLQGEAELKDYQFASKQIHHMFCPSCGVEPFGRGAMPDGSATVAVNVRCLDDIDIATLSPAPFDGRSR